MGAVTLNSNSAVAAHTTLSVQRWRRATACAAWLAAMGSAVDASVAGTTGLAINAPRERWVLSMVCSFGGVRSMGWAPAAWRQRHGQTSRRTSPRCWHPRLSGGPDEAAQVLAVDADLHTAARLLSEGLEDRLRRPADHLH